MPFPYYSRIIELPMADKKLTCKNGHRLMGKNLYLRKNGGRECRKCSLARSAKAREK